MQPLFNCPLSVVSCWRSVAATDNEPLTTDHDRKQTGPSFNRAAHAASGEPVKTHSPAHPVSFRLSGPWARAIMASCLCNRMGRLVNKAQVHPGRSGLKKVDLAQVN